MRVLSVKVQVNTCYLACHVTRGPGSKPTQAVDWVSHSLCQSRVSTGGCAARTSFKVLLLLPCFQTDHPYTHQPACLPACPPACLPARPPPAQLPACLLCVLLAGGLPAYSACWAASLWVLLCCANNHTGCLIRRGSSRSKF